MIGVGELRRWRWTVFELPCPLLTDEGGGLEDVEDSSGVLKWSCVMRRDEPSGMRTVEETVLRLPGHLLDDGKQGLGHGGGGGISASVTGLMELWTWSSWFRPNRSSSDEVVNVDAYDGPQLYNYEPVRCPIDHEQTRIRRNNNHRGEI